MREGLPREDGKIWNRRHRAENPARFDGGNRNRYGNRNHYGNRNARAVSEPPLVLNGRDFNGGVGYGRNGDMGYQGGYGRNDPRNGNFDMNGGAMSNAAAARFNAWHGYNSHNGPGNGY